MTKQNQILSLSQGQRALAFLHRKDPSGHAYNMQYAWYIRSSFKAADFKAALEIITARYEALRSTLQYPNGKPVQVVHPHREVRFREVDAAHWDQAMVLEKVKAEAYRPFNFEEESPVRWTYFNRDEQPSVLFLGMHHAFTDLWSVVTLFNDLKTLLSGDDESQLLPVRSLEDFTEAEDRFIESPEGLEMLAFWKQELAGDPPKLQYPTDHPRSGPPTYEGESYHFALPQQLMANLLDLAKEVNASPFMICSAAYHVFLHRYTGQDDIITAVPTAGREEGGLFHYCVNLVALRSHPHPNATFRDFLEQIKGKVKTALKNQKYPFSHLVGQLDKTDSGSAPIFQTSFVWENANRFENRDHPLITLTDNNTELWDLGDLKLERILLRTQLDDFDIIMKMVKLQNRYYGLIDYNPHLFEKETIARTAENFKTLLAAIAANPDQTLGKLDLLSEEERQTVLVDWNPTNHSNI